MSHSCVGLCPIFHAQFDVCYKLINFYYILILYMYVMQLPHKNEEQYHFQNSHEGESMVK